MHQAVEQSALRAAALERNEQVDRLLEAAGPALCALALSSEALTVDRADYLVLEARLRDTIRARALAREPLISLADAARRKGINVVLLDDTNGTRIALADGVRVVDWISGLLQLANHGGFTARIAVEPHGLFATVVANDNYFRLDLEAR
jgi:hypothetical protein